MAFIVKITDYDGNQYVEAVAADHYRVDSAGVYFLDKTDKLIRQYDLDQIDFNSIERDKESG